MSLANLNSSGISQSNQALYQAIKDLIDQVQALTNLVNSFGFQVDGTELQANVSSPLSLTGGGLQFPFTQKHSTDPTTLDDYHEGVWTPLLAVAGSTAGIVQTQNGTYTKIGRIVVLEGFLNVTNLGAGAGAVTILGAPFATIFTESIGFADFAGGFVGPGYVGQGAGASVIFLLINTAGRVQIQKAALAAPVVLAFTLVIETKT